MNKNKVVKLNAKLNAVFRGICMNCHGDSHMCAQCLSSGLQALSAVSLRVFKYTPKDRPQAEWRWSVGTDLTPVVHGYTNKEFVYLHRNYEWRLSTSGDNGRFLSREAADDFVENLRSMYKLSGVSDSGIDFSYILNDTERTSATVF
jgi:hypothetical protein